MEAFQVFYWSLQTLPQIAMIASAAAVIYLLPGLAVLKLLGGVVSLERTQRLILALGIGVALPPLLLEVSALIHLPWQRWTVIVYLVVALLVLIIPFIRKRPKYFLPHLSPSWHTMLLLWLLGLILLVRLYAIRDLPVGMWGDSYQHTMMAQLLVDNGGLFTSWEPYASLSTFTYHFGFHANVAFFHWLTGVPVTKSVLYVSQVLNAATVPMAFLLTVQITKSRNAGLWAALLTGFVNVLPGYYVNWGRYTQLAGQVILPAVIVCWMRVLESELRLTWRSIAMVAILTAGLALTHYIVTLFAALFLLTYLIALWAREPTGRTCKRIALNSGAIAAVSFLLITPWFLNALRGYLLQTVQLTVNGSVHVDLVASNSALSPIIPFYLKWQILIVAVVGLLIAIARRDGLVALLAVWSQLLILVVVPHVFGLPGRGLIDQFTAFLALYITVIPIAAYALGVAQEAIELRISKISFAPRRLVTVQGLAAIAIIGLSIYGTTSQSRIDPQFQLFTAADERAMEWIRTQTPSDARFLVNAFPAYSGYLIAGSDGGWWIPLLTGRRTNLPPLTYGSERGATEDFYKRVDDFAAGLRGRPLTDLAPVRIDLTTPNALQMLREARINFVYSGSQPRPGPESADHIDTKALQSSTYFRRVYAFDGVEIFQIVSGE